MDINIYRRSSSWVRTAAVDIYFNTEVPPAAISCNQNIQSTAPPGFAGAVAAWPAVTTLSAIGTQLTPGVRVLNSAGVAQPFKIRKVTSAIGAGTSWISAGNVEYDVTPGCNVTPNTTCIVSPPNGLPPRFQPVFGGKGSNITNPLFSIGDINLSDGRTGQFTRLLSSRACVPNYPYAQVDQLTVDPTNSPLLCFENGYLPSYLQNNTLFVSLFPGLQGFDPGTVNEFGALSSIVSITVDDPFPSFSESAATDLYLYVPQLLSVTNQTQQDNATSSNSFALNALNLQDYVNARGAVVALIIPLRALGLSNTIDSAILDTQDKFANATFGSAWMSFRMQTSVTIKPLSQLSFFDRPTTVPTAGYI